MEVFSSVRRRVLVAGGGVAGLAVARALGAAGAEVVVLERDADGLRGGHGFILSPAAGRALAALGLEPMGQPLGRFELRGVDDTLVGAEALTQTRGVTRAAVVAALGADLPACAYRRGHRVADFRRVGDRADVLLDSGQWVSADLVVAADGVQSPLRGVAFPGARPTPAQVRELVGHVEAPGLAASLGDRFVKFEDPARRRALGLVPCGGQRVVWYLQAPAASLPGDPGDRAAIIHALRNRLRDWPPLVMQLAELVSTGRTHLWNAADLEPLPALHGPGLALVGDAAHAFLPFTSQGVAAALADAVALRDTLEAAGWFEAAEHAPERLEAGLRAYDAARRPAIARTFLEGRQMQARFLAGVLAEPAGRVPAERPRLVPIAS